MFSLFIIPSVLYLELVDVEPRCSIAAVERTSEPWILTLEGRPTLFTSFAGVSTLFMLALLVLWSVVCEPFLLCNKFLPLKLEILAAELGALLVREVLTVATDLREDFEGMSLRGDLTGIGGGGGIGIAGLTPFGNSLFSTNEAGDLFFKIGFKSGALGMLGFCF
jgi:hypothetical protein